MNIRCPSCGNALSVAGGHARVQCPFCRTVIDVGGSAPPPTAAPVGFSGSSLAPSGTAAQTRARSRSSGSNMQMIVVACVLLMLVGGGVIVGLTMLRTPAGKEKAGGSNQPVALTKAQEMVAKQFEAAAKVQFDENPKLRQVQDNEWTVESHLQYRNRAGKLMRQTYSARVRLEGPNDWRVEVLEIGGRAATVASAGPSPDVKDPSDTQPTAVEPVRDERTVRRAMQMLGSVFEEAATLRKTLVVWLFDVSPSATQFREEVAGGFDPAYSALRKHRSVSGSKEAKDKEAKDKDAKEKEAPAADAKDKDSKDKLQMAVMTFDDEISVVTDQPISDDMKLREILGKLSEGKGGHERPFGAMQKALEKFGDFTKQGGRLHFVVVTDEAGDDDEKVIESTIPALKKAGVQVYVLGKEAPLGRSAWPEGNQGFSATPRVSSDPLHQGPESLYSERINLQFFQRSFADKFFEVPSGFGPYQLCRVCQQTDGAFFICEQGGGSHASGWDNSSSSYTFASNSRARYAPKYVSADEYRKMVASNKALKALHEAAKLPEFDLVTSLQFEFMAGDEARLNQALGRAQQGVARTEPKLKELSDILTPGISDRPKLTEPRLQAGFDLAIGRLLATQSRVEGYNAMLAILKGGKRFKNSGSRTWVLEAADTTGAGSKYAKAIADSHMYLERIIKDHPNTPWAYFAKRELEAKMGWEWGER